MTDTFQTEDTQSDPIEDAYEAARTESEGEATETIVEPEDGQADKEALSDADKVKASLKDRAAAARREKQGRLAAEERANALEARLAALEGQGKKDDLSLDDIDANTDPIGAVERMAAILKAQRAEQASQAQQSAAQAQQHRNIQALTGWAGEMEADFRAEKPDYDDAAKFVYDSRMREVEMISGNPQAAQQSVQNELLGLIAQCKQSNRDPAEVIYNLAQQRGFKNTVKIDNAAEKLQTLKRGQEASRTLSGGKADSAELTIESINRMPSDQRYAAYQKLRAREMEREARG